MDIPEWMEPYVQDYTINVFEIAWLSEKELNRFYSDFRIVARFFVEKRKNPEYIPDDPMIIKHVDEFLKLMAVLTGDNRYVMNTVIQNPEHFVKEVTFILSQYNQRTYAFTGIHWKDETFTALRSICTKIAIRMNIQDSRCNKPVYESSILLLIMLK